MTTYRIEEDCLGQIKVKADKYWKSQTQRSLENFKIGQELMPKSLIHSFAILKEACAKANLHFNKISEKQCEAIVKVCQNIEDGQYLDQFPLHVWQTGSGTQTNMNANEVIANRAIEILGGKKGDYSAVNPNDDVNCGQSTNDVIPTAGKMTSLRLLQNLKKELLRLHGALCKKAEEFDHVIGLNRLCAVHFNDSMNDRGSHKDRHACIGKGKIGLDAMRRVATHPLLSDKPFILETPNDDEGYRREIALFREWRE